MSNMLFSYPEPSKNPACVCQSPHQAFFCLTGHMLECHSGFRCDEAKCSHLAGYGVSGVMKEAPAWTVSISRGEQKFIPTIVYAPTAEKAESAVRFWINQTKNLSQIKDELIFVTNPATEKDFADFEALKAEKNK